MATAEANGQQLYYEIHSEGEPLLCVAGLSCDTLVWIPQIEAFSSEYRTVIFDNRDVGQSSMAEGDYEIADMARDALALADELELDTFHLLGVSMGGAIAQEVALQAPGRVRTLTLTVTFSTGGTYSRKLAEVWGARVKQISHEQHIDELMLLNHSEEFFENADMVAFIRTSMLQNPHPQPPEAFARQLAACSRHDTRDREHDILVPVWKSKEIAAAIPGAKLDVLPAAPHGLSLERAEEFNAGVLGFIRETAAAPAA
jgi:3-oxoadipate enol-lactonase